MVVRPQSVRSWFAVVFGAGVFMAETVLLRTILSNYLYSALYVLRIALVYDRVSTTYVARIHAASTCM